MLKSLYQLGFIFNLSSYKLRIMIVCEHLTGRWSDKKHSNLYLGGKWPDGGHLITEVCGRACTSTSSSWNGLGSQQRDLCWQLVAYVFTVGIAECTWISRVCCGLSGFYQEWHDFSPCRRHCCHLAWGSESYVKKGNTLVCEMIYSSGDGSQCQNLRVSVPVLISS